MLPSATVGRIKAREADMQRDSETFEYWLKLAKSDPALFEVKRLEAIEAAIQNAPVEKQQRLRGLQWRIDAERRKAKNPLDACLKVYNMMWDKVYGSDGLLEALDTMTSGAPKPKSATKKAIGTADVVAFRGNSKA